MKRFFARERPVVAPEGCLGRTSTTRRWRGCLFSARTASPCLTTKDGAFMEPRGCNRAARSRAGRGWPLYRELAFLGPLVLAPATVSVLALGIALVVDTDAWNFGQLWVQLGLGLFVGAFLVGAIHQSRTRPRHGFAANLNEAQTMATIPRTQRPVRYQPPCPTRRRRPGPRGDARAACDRGRQPRCRMNHAQNEGAMR
jgi:hypothetical protein